MTIFSTILLALNLTISPQSQDDVQATLNAAKKYYEAEETLLTSNSMANHLYGEYRELKKELNKDTKIPKDISLENRAKVKDARKSFRKLTPDYSKLSQIRKQLYQTEEGKAFKAARNEYRNKTITMYQNTPELKEETQTLQEMVIKNLKQDNCSNDKLMNKTANKIKYFSQKDFK
jgi:hypothetical protein